MSDIVGPALLSVGQGMNSFSTFLPNFTEIRRADISNNPEIAADVRMGVAAAGVATIGIGVIASSLVKSPAPAYTAVVMTVILAVLYESTLRTNNGKEKENG